MTELLEPLYQNNWPSVWASPFRVILVFVLGNLIFGLWSARRRFTNIELWYTIIGSVGVFCAAILNVLWAALTFKASTTPINVISLCFLCLLVYGMSHRVGSISYLIRTQGVGMSDRQLMDVEESGR